GQIEAAFDAKKYAFGVDSDQAALLPDYAKNIPTSALKNVGNSLYRAIKLDLEGKLNYGTAETLGFAEGGVELVEDAHYAEIVPEGIRTKVEALKQKIVSGEIKVKSATNMSTEEIDALRNAVKA
ncbi:MAG: BMP family ABC transporter substrate-binding protein, partial [Oscillospiraceae bacterium]